MKKIVILFSFLLCLFSSGVVSASIKSLPYPRLDAAIPLDKIVVVVNTTAITEHEVAAAVYAAKQQLRNSNVPLPSDKVLRKQVINNLINRALLLQVAKRAKITVSSEDLADALRNIAKQNHMTLAKLKNSIEMQRGNYSKFRQQIREQLLFSQLFKAAVGSNITVSDQEVNAYLQQKGSSNKQYKVSDILIALPDEPTPKQIQKAKELANSLLKKIKKGASFKKLAVSHSGGENALQAGDLGWRRLAELPTIFEKTVKTMKGEQVAGPLLAPNGFHLLKLEGVRAGKTKLSKDQVRNLIYQRKVGEQRQLWLRKMRDQAYVKYM